MYPIAGSLIWLALGAFIGYLAGKITHTSGPFGLGANTGVGMVAAAGAGFVSSVLWNGEKSGDGFLLSIVVAGAAALVGVYVFRKIYPHRSPRFEDSSTELFPPLHPAASRRSSSHIDASAGGK